MSNMKKNRKAFLYGVVVLVFTTFMLIWALNASSFKKINHEKSIGEEQIELIKEYSKGESILFYIDQSAKYSFYNAIYLFAEKGIYLNDPGCKYYSEEYVMWENVLEDEAKEYHEVDCYPEERDIAMNFALFLNNELDEYFKIYPSAIIPKDNYDFNFNAGEIKGIATRNIILNKSNTTIYSLKPSFKMNVSYDFIDRFKDHIEKTLAIRNNIQGCLWTTDSDLETCSNIGKLKTEIEGIEGYKIDTISSAEKYTLLFDIEDASFKNPYSDEKLILKFGISFIPPATEVIDIEPLGGIDNDPDDITI